MADLSEDNASLLWQKIDNKSWESLYNLLYNDYYEGHKVGLDRDLVYQIMQIALKFEGSNVEFPQTVDQFHGTLSGQLGG